MGTASENVDFSKYGQEQFSEFANGKVYDSDSGPKELDGKASLKELADKETSKEVDEKEKSKELADKETSNELDEKEAPKDEDEQETSKDMEEKALPKDEDEKEMSKDLQEKTPKESDDKEISYVRAAKKKNIQTFSNSWYSLVFRLVSICLPTSIRNFGILRCFH